MARKYFRYNVHDRAGNVVQNAAVYVFAVGTGVEAEPPTGTAITGSMYAARTGGSAIANPLITNSQGDVEAWADEGQTIDIVVVDNSNAAFFPSAPSQALSWTPFKEIGYFAFEPEDVGAGGGGGVTDHGALTGLGDDDHPHYETSAEAAAKVTTHEAAGNPHPTYETSAEAAAKITAHEAAVDPHPTYETAAEAQAKIDAHVNDFTDAHDADAISIRDTADDFTATDVEGALAELQSDNEAHAAAGDPHPVYETSAEAQAKVDTHTSDATAAHAATAVGFTPAGTIAATDVQAAIEEVAAEAGGGGGGAPTDAPYIVTTPNAGLSAEVAFGTDPPTYTGAVLRGLAANKPAGSAFTGQLFFETDGSRIAWRGNTASGWEEVARGEAGVRLAQLAEKSHASLTGVTNNQHGWSGTIYFGPPFGITGGAQWTNQPAPEAYWNGASLMAWRGSLADSTEFRWGGNCWNAGFAGSEVILSYSTDNGSTWTDIDSELLTAHNWNTAWAAIPAGAKVDPVMISIRGRGGNGVADPAIEHISVMFR